MAKEEGAEAQHNRVQHTQLSKRHPLVEVAVVAVVAVLLLLFRRKARAVQVGCLQALDRATLGRALHAGSRQPCPSSRFADVPPPFAGHARRSKMPSEVRRQICPSLWMRDPPG